MENNSKKDPEKNSTNQGNPIFSSQLKDPLPATELSDRPFPEVQNDDIFDMVG